MFDIIVSFECDSDKNQRTVNFLLKDLLNLSIVFW